MVLYGGDGVPERVIFYGKQQQVGRFALLPRRDILKIAALAVAIDGFLLIARYPAFVGDKTEILPGHVLAHLMTE
jgi:hypothetical protein